MTFEIYPGTFFLEGCPESRSTHQTWATLGLVDLPYQITLSLLHGALSSFSPRLKALITEFPSAISSKADVRRSRARHCQSGREAGMQRGSWSGPAGSECQSEGLQRFCCRRRFGHRKVERYE